MTRGHILLPPFPTFSAHMIISNSVTEILDRGGDPELLIDFSHTLYSDKIFQGYA